MSSVITKLDIEQAQRLWAEAVIKIGHNYMAKGDYQLTAKQLLDQLYAYHCAAQVVLFKPTYVQKTPFRNTYEGALSYFIGGNTQYEEDQGFALKPWQTIEFTNEDYYLHTHIALVMGSYVFTPITGEPMKAAYSLGYIRDNQDNLKIVLHHSSTASL